MGRTGLSNTVANNNLFVTGVGILVKRARKKTQIGSSRIPNGVIGSKHDKNALEKAMGPVLK